MAEWKARQKHGLVKAETGCGLLTWEGGGALNRGRPFTKEISVTKFQKKTPETYQGG